MARVSTKIKKIEISEQDYTAWTDFIFQFFKNNPGSKFTLGKTDAQLKKSIIQELEICSNGWERCPKKLEHRIAQKFAIPDVSVLNRNPGEIKEDDSVKRRGRPLKQELTTYNILELLSPKEKAYWEARKQQYIKDHELTGISDTILVDQCIVEEILIKKVDYEILTNIRPMDADTSRIKKEAQERLQKMHQNLGILKEQRNKELNDVDGNVATASREFDEKKELIKQLEEEERLEELHAMKEREKKPPINEIPDIDKIRAIVGDNSLSSSEGEFIEASETDS